MYYLNKIVAWMLSPLGVLFLGFAFSWVLHRFEGGRYSRLCKWIVTVLLAVVWILGCSVTTRFLGVPLEGEEVFLDDLPAADAIVLLGGGMGVHEKCGRSEMFGSADRVWTAAKLYMAGKAKKMTLSGGCPEGSTVPLLKDFGIPEDVLMFFPDARNTEEEAKFIAAAGIKKIILVTSAWHMPRARLLFERRGFEVIAAPTDYEMHCIAERPLKFADFLPSADMLSLNSYAIKEWVARFGYQFLRR